MHPSKPSPVRTLWDELRHLLAFDIHTGATLSIINRLDRETSGVVLVTETSAAARAFSKAMQGRLAEKRYLALVHGWPKDDRFTADAPLIRQGEIQPSAIWLKRMIHPSGQPSLTHGQVLERRLIEGERFSRVELRPITGRMHQLRVHLASLGHPIVGDKIYRDESCYLRFIEEGWTPALAKRRRLPRQALHASDLRFTLEDGPHGWSAPFPPDLDWKNLENAPSS